jgi:hypothetical protein
MLCCLEAIFYYVAGDDRKDVRLLIADERADLNNHINELTMFFHAVISNDLKLLRLLLAEERMNPNLLTADGQLALNLSKQVKTVEFLLRNKRIDPTMLALRGYSAFHRAVTRQMVDVVFCMI